MPGDIGQGPGLWRPLSSPESAEPVGWGGWAARVLPGQMLTRNKQLLPTTFLSLPGMEMRELGFDYLFQAPKHSMVFRQ